MVTREFVLTCPGSCYGDRELVRTCPGSCYANRELVLTCPGSCDQAIVTESLY